MRLPVTYLIAAAAAVLASAGQPNAQSPTEFQKRGEALLAKNCARCHAIGRTGASTHAEAPPFRTLSKKYPIESLAESLAEGLFTGHPDMPEFTFEAADVGAILDYLTSIQDR
jgi:mono/diheme cytochrome c family protein